MALSSLDKFAENIEGEILDGWIDLDGETVRGYIVSASGDEVTFYGDVTTQLTTSSTIQFSDETDTGVGVADVSSMSVNGNGDTTVTLGSTVTNLSDAAYGTFTGTGWQSVGHLRDPSFSKSPVNADSDAAKREKQLAWDVEASLVMEQTSDIEHRAVSEMVRPEGKGLTFKFVDRTVTRSNVENADGYEFVNVLPSASGEFDGSGEGSMYEISFGGRILVGMLDTNPTTLTFDV